MFATLSEVVQYYADGASDKHEVIYKEFEKNVNPELLKAFNSGDGFGEVAFCWLWSLLINAMPDKFNFAEVGVYKGRTLGIVQHLATNKMCTIYGISPLTNVGDKFSNYDNVNYSYEILLNLNKMGVDIDNINLIKGLSTDIDALDKVRATGPYDIIYIDGCHDYDVVCADILNFCPLIKPGGFLVMDDASLFLEKPFGRFIGHKDVCQAIKDKLDGSPEFTHLFACGHNRVWQKKA